MIEFEQACDNVNCPEGLLILVEKESKSCWWHLFIGLLCLQQTCQMTYCISWLTNC